jgi:hypothetical protein
MNPTLEKSAGLEKKPSIQASISQFKKALDKMG